MKLRDGFVSNSSSSSFVCFVTGEVESGWDLGIEDAGMRECLKGHTFQERFLLHDATVAALKAEARKICLDAASNWTPAEDATDEQKECYAKWNREAEAQRAELRAHLDQFPDDGDVDELLEWLVEEDYYEYGIVPAAMCPICRLKHIQDRDLLRWAVASMGSTREELVQHLQEQFSSQQELLDDTARLQAEVPSED